MTNRKSPYNFDLAVLGGGSAGYAAARTAVGHGLSTAVMEGAREVGGHCILRGCMPSKALLQAAEVRHLAQKGAVWGLKASSMEFDFPTVMARKNTVIEDFASHRRGQLSDGGFEFIHESARFVDPHTLELSSGQRVTAASFVVATGSTIAPPPLGVLQGMGYLISDDVITLQSLPRSLIVLGGGPVAMEFAQFFGRFGTQTTLIQRSPRVLKAFDPEMSATIESVFKEEGITVHTGTKLLDARRGATGKVVRFEKKGTSLECQAEEVLFALGRIPNTSGLGLEAAGVTTEHGRIVTDTTQRTSAPHIYAAGDCCGPYEIVHIAIQQGETAAHNIARPEQTRTVDYRLLMNVAFTDPQMASVGLTEQQAQARGIECRVASHPFNEHGKSIIMDATYGQVKLLADPFSGEILGGSCIGPSGGELIHEIVAAMHKRMTVHELATMPHYHPTLAEIWTYPAVQLAEEIAATS